jgi:Isochorismatase family
MEHILFVPPKSSPGTPSANGERTIAAAGPQQKARMTVLLRAPDAESGHRDALTDVCVLATVLDPVDLGFRALVVEDASAAHLTPATMH